MDKKVEELKVDELKVDEIIHKKLVYISEQLGEFERRKEIHVLAYRTILDSFLEKHKLDKTKQWSFDIKTGVVKEYIEEKKDGNSTDVNNTK